jgi:NAD(P)-dependent dehydrogenase (short-subunit alcohol dehydrogenase family)
MHNGQGHGLFALVTGANKGIGWHIGQQLAAAGATVYIGSRDAERCRRAVERINGDVRPLLLDVTDETSIAAAAAQVPDLDILINNAGITVDLRRPTEADPASFRRTFETNVFGVVAVTNAFLPALRRSRRPRIVNVSSGTGSLAVSTGSQLPLGATMAAYRSSKTALTALTILYAQELAEEGFKVNAYAPGLRRTGLNEQTSRADGDPADAAPVAVRLALLPDDGPTGQFIDWSGRTVPW